MRKGHERRVESAHQPIKMQVGSLPCQLREVAAERRPQLGIDATGAKAGVVPVRSAGERRIVGERRARHPPPFEDELLLRIETQWQRSTSTLFQDVTVASGACIR